MWNCSLVKRNNIPVEYLRPFILPFAAVKQQVQRNRSRWRCVEDGAIKAAAFPAASLCSRSYACHSVIVSLASTVQVHVQPGEKRFGSIIVHVKHSNAIQLGRRAPSRALTEGMELKCVRHNEMYGACCQVLTQINM